MFYRIFYRAWIGEARSESFDCLPTTLNEPEKSTHLYLCPESNWQIHFTYPKLKHLVLEEKTPQIFFQNMVGKKSLVLSRIHLKNPYYFQNMVGTLDPEYGW